ncbi:MAG: thioredoxin [Clostridiales bacterium]|nr:thioredoxin [Clostridiales bacterium]
MSSIILTNDSFDEATKSEKPVLVDFWANWCGPCKMLGPVIEEIASDFDGKAVVAKVNVDENADLAERFGIMTIPAMFIFKEGQVVEKLVGFRTKSQIASVLEKYI